MNNASMNILVYIWGGIYISLGSFSSVQKSRSGFPESKDLNNKLVISFCVASHHKRSNSKEPPFYLLINSVGQQVRLAQVGDSFAGFFSFMWLELSGTSARMRWP